MLSLLQFNTCLKIKSQITAGCFHLLRNKFQHVKGASKNVIDFALLRYGLHFETFLLLKKALCCITQHFVVNCQPMKWSVRILRSSE